MHHGRSTTMFTRSAPEPMLLLAPGQATWLRLGRGTTLRLTEGCARLLESPQWLGERVVQWPVTLEPGVPHRLARGGWVRLEALGATAARVQACTGGRRTTGVASSRPITERAYR